MHVLDPPDICALVNEKPCFQRAGEHVSNQMQFVPFGSKIHGLVRIRDRHIQHLAHLPVSPNGPRIRHNVRQSLLWIVNDEVANDRVGFERNQRLTVSLTLPTIRQQHGPDGMF